MYSSSRGPLAAGRWSASLKGDPVLPGHRWIDPLRPMGTPDHTELVYRTCRIGAIGRMATRSLHFSLFQKPARLRMHHGGKAQQLLTSVELINRTSHAISRKRRKTKGTKKKTSHLSPICPLVRFFPRLFRPPTPTSLFSLPSTGCALSPRANGRW